MKATIFKRKGTIKAKIEGHPKITHIEGDIDHVARTLKAIDQNESLKVEVRGKALLEEFNKAIFRVEKSSIVQDIKMNPTTVVADCNGCGCELREGDISYETKTKTLCNVCHAHAKTKSKAKKKATAAKKKATAAKKNPTMAKKIEGFTHQLREGHMTMKNPMNSLQQNPKCGCGNKPKSCGCGPNCLCGCNSKKAKSNPMKNPFTRTHGPCDACGVEMNDDNHKYDTSGSRRGMGAGTGTMCDKCYTTQLSQMEPMIDFATGETLVPREPIYSHDGFPMKNPSSNFKVYEFLTAKPPHLGGPDSPTLTVIDESTGMSHFITKMRGHIGEVNSVGQWLEDDKQTINDDMAEEMWEDHETSQTLERAQRLLSVDEAEKVDLRFTDAYPVAGTTMTDKKCVFSAKPATHMVMTDNGHFFICKDEFNKRTPDWNQFAKKNPHPYSKEAAEKESPTAKVLGEGSCSSCGWTESDRKRKSWEDHDGSKLQYINTGGGYIRPYCVSCFKRGFGRKNPMSSSIKHGAMKAKDYMIKHEDELRQAAAHSMRKGANMIEPRRNSEAEMENMWAGMKVKYSEPGLVEVEEPIGIKTEFKWKASIFMGSAVAYMHRDAKGFDNYDDINTSSLLDVENWLKKHNIKYSKIKPDEESAAMGMTDRSRVWEIDLDKESMPDWIYAMHNSLASRRNPSKHFASEGWLHDHDIAEMIEDGRITLGITNWMDTKDGQDFIDDGLTREETEISPIDASQHFLEGWGGYGSERGTATPEELMEYMNGWIKGWDARIGGKPIVVLDARGHPDGYEYILQMPESRRNPRYSIDVNPPCPECGGVMDLDDQYDTTFVFSCGCDGKETVDGDYFQRWYYRKDEKGNITKEEEEDWREAEDNNEWEDARRNPPASGMKADAIPESRYQPWIGTKVHDDGSRNTIVTDQGYDNLQDAVEVAQYMDKHWVGDDGESHGSIVYDHIAEREAWPPVRRNPRPQEVAYAKWLETHPTDLHFDGYAERMDKQCHFCSGDYAESYIYEGTHDWGEGEEEFQACGYCIEDDSNFEPESRRNPKTKKITLRRGSRSNSPWRGWIEGSSVVIEKPNSLGKYVGDVKHDFDNPALAKEFLEEQARKQKMRGFTESRRNPMPEGYTFDQWAKTESAKHGDNITFKDWAEEEAMEFYEQLSDDEEYEYTDAALGVPADEGFGMWTESEMQEDTHMVRRNGKMKNLVHDYSHKVSVSAKHADKLAEKIMSGKMPHITLEKMQEALHA